MSGPSPWRRPPSEPARWFPAELLAADRRRSRRRRAMASGRRLGWLVALTGLATFEVVGALAPDGWPEPLRVVVAVVVIELALLPVELVVSRLRPPGDGDPGPGPSWAAELVTIAGALVVVVPVVWLGGATGWWWAPVGVAATVLVLLRVRAGSPAAAVVGGPAPEVVVGTVAELAGAMGLARPPAVVQVPDPVPAAALEGLGGERRLVVSAGLAGAGPEVRRRMVAHELAHQRAGHVERQAAATVIVLWLGLALVAALAADGRPWAWFGVDDPWSAEALPLHVVVVLAVTGVARLPLAWLSRAHERAAEIEAARRVPWTEGREPMVRAFLELDVELDPPTPARWWSPHPDPAERLAILDRVTAMEADGVR